MTNRSAFFVQTYYSGTVDEKLTRAQELYERHASRLRAFPPFQEELDLLKRHALTLGNHMESMRLGQLCSQCATQPGGGCCSAYMADNTDSLLLLINLFLGISVQLQDNGAENCCYLGKRGCFFLVKPIFCLNYNCKNILENADVASLGLLYRLAAAVLSQQTRVETLLLDELRDPGRPGSIT